MCYHYEQLLEAARLRREMERLARWRDLPPAVTWPSPLRVAPTVEAPIIVSEDGELELRLHHFGVVPPWGAQDPVAYQRKYMSANARAGTIESLRTWKKPFQRQRCIVPVTSFFESPTINGEKRKHRLEPAGELTQFLFAGLWERIDTATGPYASFAIVTCDPSKWMLTYHHREPVGLTLEGARTWLDPHASREELLSLLVAAPVGAMAAGVMEADGPKPRKAKPQPKGLFE